MQYSFVRATGVILLLLTFNPVVSAETPVTIPAHRSSHFHYSNRPTPVQPELPRTGVCPAIYLPVVCANGARYSNACVARSHGAKNCQLKKH